MPYYRNSRYNEYGRPSVTAGSQLFSSFVILFTTAVVLYAITFVRGMSISKTLRFITILDETFDSESSMKIITQDPNIVESIPLGLSVNERSGIEFAYSFFLYVNPTTFNGNDELKHVFHKGYIGPWPLMGPGVFIRGNTNTMRVVMNTQTNPYTYVDVNNIPVQKWFHVVLNCYKNGLDIYINGGLASRLPLKNTIPYQNYQNINIFAPTIQTLNVNTITVLNSQPSNIQFNGAMSGKISSIKYARYALSINEVTALMGEGPSKKVKIGVNDVPPYNADTWWVEQQPI